MPRHRSQDLTEDLHYRRRRHRVRHPGHLAAYAGLAPVTRRSGSSIRGDHPPKGGNKQLKRAFFLSAFAALADPASRAYYDRKVRHEALHDRVEGRDHHLFAVAAAK